MMFMVTKRVTAGVECLRWKALSQLSIFWMSVICVRFFVCWFVFVLFAGFCLIRHFLKLHKTQSGGETSGRYRRREESSPQSRSKRLRLATAKNKRSEASWNEQLSGQTESKSSLTFKDLKQVRCIQAPRFVSYLVRDIMKSVMNLRKTLPELVLPASSSPSSQV